MAIKELMSYFIIYAFFGWILESLYKTIYQKKFVNSGFLYGPLCPIYGFGAVIMLLVLKNFESNIIITFLVSFFVFSIWEYIVSILLEKIFKTKYWDYSKNKFNINGRVCLKNSLYWGFLGIIFIEVVHPIIGSFINKIPYMIVYNTTASILILMFIDYIMSVIKIYNINLNLSTLETITENIKQNVERIKEYAGKKAMESEKLQHMVEELKTKQEELKMKVEKQTKRLRSAFPTIRFKKITEFFNQKIDNIRKINK